MIKILKEESETKENVQRQNSINTTTSRLTLIITSSHYNMGRTGFLLLAFVLLLHCFVLLSAAGVNKPDNGGVATKAAGGDARELYAAASANDDFLDGGKKKARGGGKKHGSQSEKGRKVHTGKLAVVGRGSSVINLQCKRDLSFAVKGLQAAARRLALRNL